MELGRIQPAKQLSGAHFPHISIREVRISPIALRPAPKIWCKRRNLILGMEHLQFGQSRFYPNLPPLSLSTRIEHGPNVDLMCPKDTYSTYIKILCYGLFRLVYSCAPVCCYITTYSIQSDVQSYLVQDYFAYERTYMWIMWRISEDMLKHSKLWQTILWTKLLNTT